MKKVIIWIILFTFVTCNYLNVLASNYATVSTDTVLVDFQPITAYKINGSNYVLAEELNYYGFDVKWDPETWSLHIFRNKEKNIDIFPADKINVLKSNFVKSRSIYKTDIVTYIGDRKVEAYNLGGETVVKVRDLSEYAYIYWNNEEILGRGQADLFPMNKGVLISLLSFELFEKYDENISLCKKIRGTNYQEAGYLESDPTYEPSWVGNINFVEYSGELNFEGLRDGIGKEIVSYDNQGYPYYEFKISNWKNNGMNEKSIHSIVDGFNKTGNKKQIFYVGNYLKGLRKGYGIEVEYTIFHGDINNVNYVISIGEADDSLYYDESSQSYVVKRSFTPFRKIKKNPNYVYGCRVEELFE